MPRFRARSLPFSVRYWLVGLGLIPLWMTFSRYIAPWVIRQLHAGNGPAFLLDALAGRDRIPIDRYLHIWEHLSRSLAAILIFGAFAGYLVARLYMAVRPPGPAAADARSDRLSVRAEETGDHAGGATVVHEHHAGPLDPVLVAVWYGLLSGLGQGLYVLVKGRFVLEPVGGFQQANGAVIWTTPLAVAATFMAFGLVLSGIRWLWPRLPATLLAMGVFAGLLTYGWLRLPSRTSEITAAILAVGTGVQAMRLARSRLPAFTAYVRRSIPRGVALVAGLALLQLAVPPVRVWLHLRGAPEPAPRTNVLFIVIDTQRADRLGLYGYESPTTPELDRLARSSITFDQAFSPSGWTFPAHASLFTGRTFLGQGLGLRYRNPLDERETTLAEVIRDAGYNTAAFVANLGYVNPQLGLGQGFLEWSGLRVTPRTAWLSGWLNRTIAAGIRRSRGQHESLFLRDADDINQDYLRWLDKRPIDRPFFVFMNYFDPHDPYIAPQPFFGMFRSRETLSRMTKGADAQSYTAEEMAQLSAAYDEVVAYLDNRLGALFRELETRGVLDSTLVVVTSDHGEQFGEHGYMDHGQNLYTQLLHVPLLIRLPGGEHGGLRVHGSVGTLDLAATVLDAIGVPGSGIGGTSFAGAWTDATSARPAFSYRENRSEAMRSVLMDGWHYIEDKSAPAELYYLPDDPGEVNDLAGSPPPGLIGELKSLLERGFDGDVGR